MQLTNKTFSSIKPIKQNNDLLDPAAIVVVKKMFQYSNIFFYNRTIAYAPIP